jgi:hypothetical protein
MTAHELTRLWVMENMNGSLGSKDSVANRCFRESKLQRPLSGDELEALAVVTRPEGDCQYLGKQTFNDEAQRTADSEAGRRSAGADCLA